ncbi:MAG TPA: hypothetical protein ENI87_15000 [bacterium]|nr:hypothetical protein [bacterium]
MEPTPAHLAAALKQLKAVLAGIPEPEPIVEEPGVGESGVGESGADDPPAEGVERAPAEGADGTSPEAEGQLAAKAKKKEPVKRLPQLDYVDAVMHITFADGLPCGYGQEARRRIEESFVDRNEFRVTEAFEVEQLLEDLEIPNLFDRCLAVRDSIAQIYNDQNGITLAFLRDASVSDRNMFFQRVPALQPRVVNFLVNLLTIEEIAFSERSTLRAQQRFGLDPKNRAVAKFLDELRACLKPYGHVPLSVGPHGKGGKPNLGHELSPACILARLGPKPKKR